MVDARCEVVLVSGPEGFADKTREVVRHEPAANGRIAITYNGGRRYEYGRNRVRILAHPVAIEVRDGQKLEVDGQIWENATEVRRFVAPEGEWAHVFYRKIDGEGWASRTAPRVRVISSATDTPGVADILGYWRNIVSRLGPDDPLRPVYESLSFVHPESALAQYLTGAPIQLHELTSPPIYPFRSNLSQRQAVENALTHSVSVIEGPPGTGKTETILNLIANIIVGGTATVGVVSYGNSAVDNVREKLDDLGFGHVIARLGRRELVDAFFEGQAQRNTQVEDFVRRTPPPPPPERLAELDTRLRRLQEADRERARMRQEIDAYSLELQHFEKHVEPGDLSQLERLPLLRRSSDLILDYLAETALENGRRVGLVGRIRKYLRYGSLRGLNPADTSVVLRLQRAFYDRQLAELTAQLAKLDNELSGADFERLVEEHSQLSVQALHAALGDRYAATRTTYSAKSYRNNFQRFAAEYPVLLSTCHALRANLPFGQLLDYLIIDEASQVNLLAAGVALASCRNLIVVGDLQQLPPIVDNDAARGVAAPSVAYDYEHQSILSSLGAVYPEDFPRTLLREHYRCDPAIIGFCNKTFYGGRLVPFTRSQSEQPMVVRRTAEGNHMRQHRGGGRSNQREIDVIVNEVIPEDCAGVPRDQIGVATPYRKQAGKVVEQFVDAIEKLEADTVHRYQGRQKDTMIMTTVLDETWRGQTGLAFVDDPQLVNVAMSRAVRKFILVTNHSLLSKSRYIRDLIGYIDYQALDAGVVDSSIVSVFDLLYRDYNERLRALAGRLRNEQKHRSEDIIWTLLHDILADAKYRHLTVRAQILLRNLFLGDRPLTEAQATYIANRASVDFVVYNRVSNRPLLGIEVDGFAFHENDPMQLRRDKLKDEIFLAYEMPLRRLPTTGSDEVARIRTALDQSEAEWVSRSI
ncbi:AAA domain-containing protein [Kribbella sp. CA-245084]|uniref:AAA domain-containing protein n=1 Tax=Kribbella sp. CA-245084 TaxID=3239940 RepID=UPI003D92DE22